MGKFIIRETTTGFIFHLKAANGETIGTSEVYSSESACKNGVESVIKHVPEAKIEDQTVHGYEELKNPKFEIYLDKEGKFRFRLKASNGQEILASQAYTVKASCKTGIRSVMSNAPLAEVEKMLK